MSPKFCPYCGSSTKTSDKFCIICGKPLLTGIPKGETKSQIKDIPEEKEPDKSEMEIKEEIPEKAEVSLINNDSEKRKSKKLKESKDIKPLPEEVKEQMVYYIEYNDIQLNKKVLVERLNEISKLTKDPKYDYDADFKKEVNIKLQAVKTLIEEMKQKESVIKKSLEEPFIVQRIQNDIETKIFQLENLSREHKLHKVDSESFEKLKEKYKQEKLELELERKHLVEGMKLWIQDLKLEKAEMSGERKLNKGRFHSKEIDEEQYQKDDKEFDLRLKKIDTKIKTLEELTK
ncbi:MAG: hypothetical protein KGD65_12240 [Candidatus Lokiarchaeota archaeon]|nr:hypothetical protein [Candidatus Lokiarchaeota archaeon]